VIERQSYRWWEQNTQTKLFPTRQSSPKYGRISPEKRVDYVGNVKRGVVMTETRITCNVHTKMVQVKTVGFIFICSFLKQSVATGP